MNFQRERAHDLWDEIQPLVARNWEETGCFKDVPLSPDKHKYTILEDAGQLHCYTVRNEGELVGYGLFFVGWSLHYSTTRQSAQDVFFIAPEYRHGRVALKFLEYVIAQLQEAGVQVDYQQVMAGHPELGRLLEHLGYQVVGTLYGKRLENHHGT